MLSQVRMLTELIFNDLRVSYKPTDLQIEEIYIRTWFEMLESYTPEE